MSVFNITIHLEKVIYLIQCTKAFSFSKPIPLCIHYGEYGKLIELRVASDPLNLLLNDIFS